MPPQNARSARRMKVSRAFAIILATLPTAAWSAPKCILPKPLGDESEHSSDPVVWGPVVRMNATDVVVKNDASPNAGIVSIHLRDKTVFFDMQATQIKRPKADAKVYVWVWLKGCATNPSRYPASALVVAPLSR